jgi:hypothetical protein
MKVSNKILFVGTILIFITTAVIGCKTQSNSKQNATIINPSIFDLRHFVGIWDFPSGNTNIGHVSFSLYLENPNNEKIRLRFLHIYMLNESGALLFSFRPTPDPNLNLSDQLHADEFTLGAQNNITFNCILNIHNNSICEYAWNYLSSYLRNVRISGLFELNDELQWFESNLCEVNIPI